MNTLSIARPTPSIEMVTLASEEHLGERAGGELRSLIGVEDLGCAIERERLSQAATQKSGVMVFDRRQESTLRRVPVHDRHQVEESFLEGDVGDVGTPDVVGVVDVETAQQVGVFGVLGVRDRGLLSGVRASECP